MPGAREGSIRHERKGRIGWVTLDIPPLNILDIEAFERLDTAVRALDGVDVLVFRSGIERVFSAGADIADHVPERAPKMLEAFHRVARRLWEIDSVTVASVPGPALGGGMELVLCCDMVVASDEAEFGQPEIEVGCFPPIAAAILPGRLGGPRAADLILTGRRVSASEAHSMGIVSRLVPAHKLEKESLQLAEDMAARSGAVVRRTLRLIREEGRGPFLEALSRSEKAYIEDILPLADAREGVEAFMQKRKPRWQEENR